MKHLALILAFCAFACHANPTEQELKRFDAQEQADIDSAEDSGPEILANAFFFALEHNNYEGAFAQYSPEMRDYFGTAAEWERAMKSNVPFMGLHAGREIADVAIYKDGALVQVRIESLSGELFNVAMRMRIIDGEWQIVAGQITRIIVNDA